MNKTCTGCKRDLPLDLFRQRKDRSRPYSRCQQCERDEQVRRYREDIELHRERGRANQARRQHEDPPGVRRIAKRALDNGGREKSLERWKRTRRERPFVWKSWKYSSYNGVRLDPIALEEMWKSQNGKCGLTGRVIDVHTAELDHIIPVSRGGSLDIGNLRWVCPEANQAKHNLTDEEFFVLCSDVSEFIGRAFLAQRERAAA